VKKRERGGDIVFEHQLITAERPYRTVSCAAPAYFLYAPRDLITIFLYNLITKRRINFC